MIKITKRRIINYIPPKVEISYCVCEAGFSVSNDNLKEENCGWDD
jgi:hypothetical protein